jgi:N-acetylneuraminate synthase/N,N'-diacetyllegionaminate synthase
MKKIKIGNRFVGEGEPCFIVAEAGANHNGKIDLAKELVKKAAESGADAIKFQTYVAGKLATKTAPKYWMDNRPQETQYEVFSKLDKLTEEEWRELAEFCSEKNIIFLSTPFDVKSADLLDELGVPAFKVASADITCLPLIKHIAKKRKPLILSTGMATIEEIRDAIRVIKSVGNDQIILLHCTLSYPTAFRDANLRMMCSMQETFPDIPIGLSDHTMGTVVPIAAVAMGAKLIEKHYTIDKSLPDSPDHRLSVDPKELREMIEQIRATEEALGSPVKGPIDSEKEALKFARRSIVANVKIPKGTVITREMITFKRPGTGISPKFFEQVIGKKAKRTIEEDEVIKADALS